MVWQIIQESAGYQQIDETSTVQNHPIGTRVEAYDETYGVGEFIYLKGVASTAVRDGVVYDEYANTTTRSVAASRGPAAIAMSANVASQYGWYQIFGAAVVKAGTVAAAGNVFSTATAGTLDDAAVAGSLWQGARFKTADGTPAAGFAVAQLSYPSIDGLGA